MVDFVLDIFQILVVLNQKITNLAPSNIVGYFDKPDRNLKGKGAPYRLTAFNRDNVEKMGFNTTIL